MKRYLSFAGLLVLAILAGADVAFAEGAKGDLGLIPLGIGMTMGVAALGGTLAQGKAITAALESIGRNPSAAGKLFTPLIIGLVFIESLVILSFVIAFGLK